MASLQQILESIQSLKEGFHKEFKEVKAQINSIQDNIGDIQKWMTNNELEDEENNNQNEMRDNTIPTLKSEVNTLKKSIDNLKEYVLKIENQSSRDNLIIDGVTEETGETDYNCYQKILKVLHQMKVPNPEDIKIVRCHHLGQFKSFSTKPRPIIFKLHWVWRWHPHMGPKKRTQGHTYLPIRKSSLQKLNKDDVSCILLPK